MQKKLSIQILAIEKLFAVFDIEYLRISGKNLCNVIE
jgi:hypothetical protein